jgi:general secretion pathway protein G
MNLDERERGVSRPTTTGFNQRMARRRQSSGLTVVEFVVALLIVGVMVAIATPSYQSYRQRAQIDQAKSDIMAMSAIIANFYQDAHAYPDSLADAGLGGMRDPWGNPYGYLNLGNPRARGQARKDHALVPINTDFDLYSMGPDGRSSPPLTAQHSRDDIVRANNGAFVGVAADY